MNRWFGLICSALLLSLVAPAAADELRPGYLEFTQKDATRWAMIWKVPLAAGVTEQSHPVLPRACEAVGAPRRDMADRALVLRCEVRCTGEVAGSRIGLSSFAGSRTDVLLRVAPLGRPVQASRLTSSEPTAEIRARPDSWQVAYTYFVTGIEHIVFGYDHLLFVIALVLLLRGGWAVAKAVTAFTIAHSLTLIGTTLGLIGLPQAPVEALIALSIIFLAVEIVKQEPDRTSLTERAPWIVAFVFGLLHGFGFAGALHEIGLPESDVPAALLTFNLGVEAGQLLIVLACLGAIAAVTRVAAFAVLPLTRMATYAIGMVASYWLIERLA